MTSYQIHEKYSNLLKDQIDTDVINTCIDDGIFIKRFKNPEETKKIAELRANGESYANIGKTMGLHNASVRERCTKVLVFYNANIRKKENEEQKTAKLANLQVFLHKVGFYNADADKLAKEISKLPIWNLENEDDRYNTLMKWFYTEVED